MSDIARKDTDCRDGGRDAQPDFDNGRWENHPLLALPETTMRFRVSTVLRQFSDALDDRRFAAPDFRVALRDAAAKRAAGAGLQPIPLAITLTDAPFTVY